MAKVNTKYRVIVLVYSEYAPAHDKALKLELKGAYRIVITSKATRHVLTAYFKPEEPRDDQKSPDHRIV